MKRFRGPLLFLLVLALLAGHYLYWYAPRERAGAPEPGGLSARLLAAAGASGAYDACFWAPYPHQNLGKLQEAVDDGAAWVGAVARVAGLPPPVLPSFGPFTVPPSSEVAGCSDLSGGRFLIVARVYPALATVARLSGKVADNPWLAGGEVRDLASEEGEPTERTLTVAWRDGYWTVSSGAVPDFSAAPPASPARPASLGVFRLLRDVSQFPLGDYVLRREGEDLVLALDQENPPAPPEPDLPPQVEPVLLAVAGPAWPASEPRPLPPAAFALFELEEVERTARISSLGSLPGAAVFNVPGEGQRFSLPAQGIAGLVTKSLPKGNAGGWKIVAVDATSLRQARALAPRLTRLTAPDANGPLGDGGRLVIGLWARPRPALQVVAEIRRLLEGLPLVSRAQVRTWKDWETLLRPLAHCERLELTSTQTPPSFRLELQRCGTKPPAAP